MRLLCSQREHVIGAAGGNLRAILKAAARVSILATSR